jgi:hypothetical protein
MQGTIQLSVGDYAYQRHTNRLGKVTKVFTYNGETLFRLHYFDRNTKRLLICPDLRCDNKKTTCPIHGANLRHSECVPMTPQEIKTYKAMGLIS